MQWTLVQKLLFGFKKKFDYKWVELEELTHVSINLMRSEEPSLVIKERLTNFVILDRMLMNNFNLESQKIWFETKHFELEFNSPREFLIKDPNNVIRLIGMLRH